MTNSLNVRMKNVRYAKGIIVNSQFDWQWITTTKQAKSAVFYADIAIIGWLAVIAILIYFGELLPILR